MASLHPTNLLYGSNVTLAYEQLLLYLCLLNCQHFNASLTIINAAY